MKELIKNILKENEENNLEQRFRNSMQKLQYIFESSISSEIDSVEISEIEFDPKYNQIQAKLTVKSLFEDNDFGSIPNLPIKDWEYVSFTPRFISE